MQILSEEKPCFWLPEYVAEQQAAEIILDAFKRRTHGQLELLDLKVNKVEFSKDRDEIRQRWEVGERFEFYFSSGHKQPETI